VGAVRRKRCVKAVGAAVRGPLRTFESGRMAGSLYWSDPYSNLIQELAMADVAFVVATIAVFALVALVAKGVAKL
jgi:hypothetical protein